MKARTKTIPLTLASDTTETICFSFKEFGSLAFRQVKVIWAIDNQHWLELLTHIAKLTDINPNTPNNAVRDKMHYKIFFK